jgi:hypothetical protein
MVVAILLSVLFLTITINANDLDSLIVYRNYFTYGFYYGTDKEVSDTLSLYQEWHSSVYTLLSSFLNETSLVFDMFAGSGMNEVSLGFLIPGCRLISIEENKLNFDILSKNSLENDILDRSLLLHDQPSYIINADGTNGNYLDRNVEFIYKLLFNQCPNLIKFNYPASSNDDIVEWGQKFINSLLNSLSVINICQPILYIDMSRRFLSYPIISILLSLHEYSLYWHISTSISIKKFYNQDDNSILISMIAIPRSKKYIPNKEYYLVPYEGNKFFLDDYEIVIGTQFSKEGSLGRIGRKEEIVKANSSIDGYNVKQIKQRYDKMDIGRGIEDNDDKFTADFINGKENLDDEHDRNENCNTNDNYDDYENKNIDNFMVDFEEISVPLEILIEPFTYKTSQGFRNTSMYCSDDTINIDNNCSSRGSGSQYNDHFNSMMVQLKVPASPYISQIVESKCTTWIISQKSPYINDDIPVSLEINENSTESEINNMQHALYSTPLISNNSKNLIHQCKVFVIKRFEILETSYRNIALIHERRSMQYSHIDCAHKYSSTNNSQPIFINKKNSSDDINESDNAFNDKIGENDETTVRDPFKPTTQRPFSINYDSNKCGDPVWCGEYICIYIYIYLYLYSYMYICIVDTYEYIHVYIYKYKSAYEFRYIFEYVHRSD